MKTGTSHLRSLSQALKRKAEGCPEWAYFDHRVRSPEEARMPLPYKRLAPPDAEHGFAHAMKNPASSRSRVIYLHIPFCRQICPFCGYNRQLLTDETLAERYVESVIAQIQRYSDMPWTSARPAEAVYFGGGTPTALPPHELVRLTDSIRRAFPLTEDCEITVESRFDGIEADDLRVLADAGVNRLSFGVQSFDTDIRQGMGRIHDREHLLSGLQLAKEQGFGNICIDLIYNLPRQSPETWTDDLKQIAHTHVTGISVYPLILSERSRLSSQIREGAEPPLRGPEAEYHFHTTADHYLTEVLKWQCFTPVQYAEAAKDKARYVRARGQGCEILGIGAGAAGMIHDIMYVNSPDIEAYMADQTDDCDSHMMVLQLPRHYPEAQAWYRLSESDGIKNRKSLPALPGMEKVIAQLTELDVVAQIGDGLRLTRTGRFWAGNISAIISEKIQEADAEK